MALVMIPNRVSVLPRILMNMTLTACIWDSSLLSPYQNVSLIAGLSSQPLFHLSQTIICITIVLLNPWEEYLLLTS